MTSTAIAPNDVLITDLGALSDKQIQAVRSLVSAYDSQINGAVKIEAWADDESNSGEMGVTLTEDGLTMVAFFDRDGQIVGNWA